MYRHPQTRPPTWDAERSAAMDDAFGGGRRVQREPADVAALLCADHNDAARCVAAIWLGTERRPEGEGPLLAALEDESEAVRRTAAEALLELGSIRALAAVVAGSRHGHAVRTHAAFRLRDIGPPAAPAVPALMTLLRYPDINWRSHAAALTALAAIGETAIPVLTRFVRNRDPHLQDYAAEVLKEISAKEQRSEV